MIGKKTSSGPERTAPLTELGQQSETENSPREYVIQRSSETVREWWTGTQWSEDENQALHYSHKPDVSVETLDESAKALTIDEIDD